MLAQTLVVSTNSTRMTHGLPCWILLTTPGGTTGAPTRLVSAFMLLHPRILLKQAPATDPVDPSRLYVAAGMYTNSWDPNNGQILRSSDYGKTWSATNLSFKLGGNMPGRGMGEVS